MFYFIDTFFKKIAIFLIKTYQKTMSFDHGPLRKLYPQGFCRFNPSCSQYAILAIEKYGIIKGGLKASWRIIRCNPWNHGGNDPLR
jgi:hypothetical protein